MENKYQVPGVVEFASWALGMIGVSSICFAIFALSEGRLQLDPFILSLFAGMGIYRGENRWRIVGVIISIGITLVSALLLVLLVFRADIFHADQLQWRDFSPARKIASYGVVLFGTSLGISLLYALLWGGADSFFKGQSSTPREERNRRDTGLGLE